MGSLGSFTVIRFIFSSATCINQMSVSPPQAKVCKSYVDSPFSNSLFISDPTSNFSGNREHMLVKKRTDVGRNREQMLVNTPS